MITCEGKNVCLDKDINRGLIFSNHLFVGITTEYIIQTQYEVKSIIKL